MTTQLALKENGIRDDLGSQSNQVNYDNFNQKKYIIG